MADDTTSSSPGRPTLAVTTIGHHRCGKTTLTSAITRVLARRSAEVEPVTPEELDRRSGCLPFYGPPDGQHVTIRGSQVHYATPRRVFIHVDCPGKRPWLRNAARCQALADALILVVSGKDSVQPQTREHLLVAQSLGLRQLVVFMNRCDEVTDLELLDLAEQETRELLGRCGFDGDSTPVIRGSALRALAGDEAWEAGIHDLIEALTVHMTPPERAGAGEPLLYINQVFSIRGVGPVAQGRLRRGSVHPGDRLRMVGLGDELAVLVKDVEVFRRKVEVAEAGEFVGLALQGIGRGLGRYDVPSGAALLAGDAKVTRQIQARLELFAADLGRQRPIFDGHTASLLFGTTAISGRVRLPQPILMPGEALDVTIDLMRSVYLEPGMPFVMRDGTQPRWKQGDPALWGGSCGSGRVLAVTPA